MTPYARLSLDERKSIKHLLSQGYGINAIAHQLNRSNSTISREIKRTFGESETYYPALAHLSSQKQQRSRRLGKRKIDHDLGSLIEIYLMEHHFSPEQISHYVQRKHNLSISHESIYQYIYRCKDVDKRKRMIRCLRRRKRSAAGEKVLMKKEASFPTWSLFMTVQRQLINEKKWGIGRAI